MLITKLRTKECREFLARLGLGRLACACNDRPYIVPIYFSFDADRLYCFSKDIVDAAESSRLRGGRRNSRP
jgi:uncharacterized protein